MRLRSAFAAAVAVFLASTGTILAQTGDAKDAADLAKKLSNPISDLISVPIQANYACCFANTNATQWLTNFQPVVPISISHDWNVIVRTILPIINEQSSPIHP